MKQLLNKLIEHQSLDYQEAKLIIEQTNTGQFNDFQLIAIMTALQMRGVNLQEMKGFQDALLEFALPIDLSAYQGIDLCGTGGDGKNTFNISTTTSLVLASMGFKVIKHGNYGVSSVCGSSNVLEFLGFQFYTQQDELEKELDTKNIAFLHAPAFHPTLSKVGKLRKDLGIRTFFNCLGPLVNPAKPSFQMTGTFSLELAKIYPFLLKDKRENFKVIYSLDGYDELTLTHETKILGKSEDHLYSAETFQTEKVVAEQIFGGNTIEEAARIMLNILKGEGTKQQNEVIAANVATAIDCMTQNGNLLNDYHVALEQIESGKSAQFFKLN
ncbi:MAG: anthranilate phosphoribosyltransferase [Flavobacteriia bacterium]|jgi:anthranilate phosphoribosyltransferase